MASKTPTAVTKPLTLRLKIVVRSNCGSVLRHLTGLIAIVLCAGLAGCTFQGYANTFSAPIGAPPANQSAAAAAQAQTSPAPPIALPFKGRLIDGNPDALPPAVAAALSDNGTVTFNYREELSHDHYTVPLALSAFDPLTYAGYPLGSYSVTAFATLGISQGDRVLGDYTAKVHLTREYTLYYQPTYLELDHKAKAEVREKIDQQLYRDAARLAQAAAAGTSR
jgi:hypothetical protein